MKARTLLAGSAMFSVAVAIAQPAWSQTATAAPAEKTQVEESEVILVTGSRIRRPNLESPVPVTAISGAEFFETGKISVGDTLNELPALRSTFTTANSTRFLGTAGLNLLDLRGLGTARTLVLVNGRRHVGSDILSNGISPDTNTFPTDLIESVEVVTGGNSAVYGSDAIAGVVNFKLKQDYEGIQIRGQGGISKYSDAGSYYISGLAGTNFADGRGNVAVNIEYARQNAYYASQRPNLSTASGFVIVDTDIRCPGSGCDPNVSSQNSDGVPDRVFFNNIRSVTLSNKGGILFTAPAGSPATTFSRPFIFNSDGTLVPQTGLRIGIAPNGSMLGGNTDTLREGKIIGLAPNQDRYSVNLIGHFELSEAFEPFIEAKYVRVNSLGSASGPAFFQGSTLDGSRERPRLDNPFLTQQARDLITQQLLITNPAAVITGATRFALRKNLTDLGVRQEKSKRETYRAVVGARGVFNDDWQYEVSANYGEFKEKTTILGNLNIQRFLLAMDSTRDGAGKIVCRSQISPAAAISLGGAFADARLADDVAKCVPINPFGLGNISPEARAYTINDTTVDGKITQFVLNGFVGGDTSSFLNLPGGPVGFAVGAEYRRETNYYQQDPLVDAGLTFYNSIPTFTSPAFVVKEAFGELRLPILKDSPFAHNLSINLAGRVSDYKITGTTYAYTASLEYAPIADLRLRANYSRAVRAPTLSDLFSAPGQNFQTVGDPCSLRNISTGSATRAANCRTDGMPAGYDYVYSSSLETQSGGNRNLKAEKSDSYTVGGIFTPRFAPGLSLTVDYYNITVNKVITGPSGQQILNACYDAASLDNQFCRSFQRNKTPGAGSGPNGEDFFRVIEGSMLQLPFNYAKLKATGIDVEFAYSRQIEGLGKFSTRLNYTHVISRDSFLNPADPKRADRVLTELGDPKDSFNWDVNLKTGKFTIGYQMRFLSQMVVNAYEDFFSVQGREPENADYADQRFFPSVFYHDIRVGFDLNDKYNFYTGVDNFMNKQPPLGATGIGAGSAIYDNRGRYFYAGITAKF